MKELAASVTLYIPMKDNETADEAMMRLLAILEHEHIGYMTGVCKVREW